MKLLRFWTVLERNTRKDRWWNLRHVGSDSSADPWWRRRVSGLCSEFSWHLFTICQSEVIRCSGIEPGSLNRSSPRTLSPSLKMIRFWLPRSDKQCNSALCVLSKCRGARYDFLGINFKCTEIYGYNSLPVCSYTTKRRKGKHKRIFKQN